MLLEREDVREGSQGRVEQAGSGRRVAGGTDSKRTALSATSQLEGVNR